MLKVEPSRCDDYRHMGFQVDGRSTNFALVNRGKPASASTQVSGGGRGRCQLAA